MSCLDDETVAAFVLGELPDEQRPSIELHLSRCATCTTLVAEYGKFFFQTHEPSLRGPRGQDTSPPLDAGTVVSRFVITRLLGRGGAAEVYEAWDPKLKRKVAVKLLHELAAENVTPAAAEARLLQEAEAMARLAHPNVVAVYDAGTFGERVFIVMELVEGETLGQWLRAARHEPGAILAVFLAAGRGLQAAHAAGIVHRDFKPENVLVGIDGRARVTDFGLARAQLREGSDDVAASRSATMDGGTPLYMSPEQHRGVAATARSDQWSFCLALARALFGRDPFGLEARQAWAQGVDRDPPNPGAARGVPRALARTLARGLANDPERRFADMSGLLERIEAAARPPRAGAKRAAAMAVAALLVAAVAGGAIMRGQRTAATCGNGVVEPGEECDGSETCSAWCVRCDGGNARYSWPQTGACYERFDSPLRWSRAAEACADRGGDLVSFGSAAEAVAIADSLVLPDPPSWIGLRRHDGTWSWSSGDPWADPLPRFWSDVPKPPGGDCVTQRRATPVRRIQIRAEWSTAACDEPHPFICERAPWRRFPRTGHAYRLMADSKTWKNAEAACRRMGAHLATITDEEENAFLTSFLTLPVWLGAKNEVTRGPYAWVTGEAFSFAPFAPREPDLDDMPACLALGVDDLWHDRACGGSHPYLCEAE